MHSQKSLLLRDLPDYVKMSMHHEIQVDDSPGKLSVSSTQINFIQLFLGIRSMVHSTYEYLQEFTFLSSLYALNRKGYVFNFLTETKRNQISS